MQTYHLEANGDHDFLEFLVDRIQTIGEIIQEAVPAEPKKVQLSAKVKLEKPVIEDKDATDLTIRVNSKIETVCLGERQEGFSTMFDQMLSSLFSFTSRRIGWMLKEINGPYVKLLYYIRIRVSSYRALPSELQSMNCLLNIRDRTDNNCFLFCYVAVWPFAYAQSV